MKKTSLLLALVFVFTLSMGVSANSAGDMETVGGITYNTFALEGNAPEELKSGLGFYGGGQYWISDQIAIEAGIDYAGASTTIERSDFSHNIIGPYAKLNLKLNETISLNAGGSFYSGTIKFESNYNYRSISFNSSGVGLLLGGKIDYPIDDSLEFTADLSYRLLDMGVDSVEVDGRQVYDPNTSKTYNMGGLRIGAALSYKF